MKVGDNVYLVYDDARRGACHVVIKSIGSKYITVSGVHRTEARYDKLTKRSVDDNTGWNCKAELFESKEKYFEQQLEDMRINEIRQRIIHRMQLGAIEPKMLYTIAKLLKIETEIL